MDSACAEFMLIFKLFVSECVPSRVVLIRPKDKPWFDSELRKEMRLRDRLRNKAKVLNTFDSIDKYKKQRNRFNNLKNSAKENFYLNLDGRLSTCAKRNNTSYWKLLKYIIKDSGSSSLIPPLITNDNIGPTAFSDYEKAEALNNYFVSVSQSDEEDAILPFFKIRCNQEIDIIFIEKQEISDLIKSLPANKASSPDDVNHRLLKHVSETIAEPLQILFNMSLEKCIFPSQWKMARVLPLFKKGDKSVPSNYRPISLLSCLGKLFERLAFKHLHNHFNKHKLLCKYQSGFLPGHSTVHQLIEIYHQICRSLDQHDFFRMDFCDVSKAVDRVWHSGLIYKLNQYGIKGNLLRWINDYLSDRSQQVFVNGSLSSPQKITAGVPQGSVLGPFLFLVYINDISESLLNITRLFAYDTNIGISSANIKEIENKLNSDLLSLNVWAESWLVKFNPSKTKYMFFSHKNVDLLPHLVFNGSDLEHVKQHKHLGVTFSSDTKWSWHINNIISSASKMVASMRKLKYILNRKNLTRIYSTYIRPILE